MTTWTGKRIVILGLARQGSSLARYFARRGAEVIVSDLKSERELRAQLEALEGLPIRYVLGAHPSTLLDGADLLCLSGGVPADLPLVQEARAQGLRIANDAQLFLEVCPALTIGITGSAGKTTTTTLVGRMGAAALKASGNRAWVGGNIGRPLIEDVEQIAPEDAAVLELSSFQLELMSVSPQIAAVLNLTPNHLDRHRTMDSYTAAKANILHFQRPNDLAVLNHEDAHAWSLAGRVRGRLFSFGEAEPPGEGVYLRDGEFWLATEEDQGPIAPLDILQIPGRHNLLNAAAACAIAAAAGWPRQAMRAGLEGFLGVEHRLEFVREYRGARWYNDSIATSPERAIAAMRSFEGPLIVIAGGRDKDLPWDGFAREVQQRASLLLLFGEAAEKIEAAVRSFGAAGPLQAVRRVEDLPAAVLAAAEAAVPGQVVLLAPGGTSFDAYLDFAERGDHFKALVNAL